MVARRHRKAVGFTNCRNTDDPHVDIEVVHHLPDQDQLLVVLFTEKMRSGRTICSSFSTTVSTLRSALGENHLRVRLQSGPGWTLVRGPAGYMADAVG